MDKIETINKQKVMKYQTKTKKNLDIRMDCDILQICTKDVRKNCESYSRLTKNMRTQEEKE